MRTYFLYLAALLILLSSCGQNTGNTTSPADTLTTVSNTDSNAIMTAKEAFVFGLPLVLMDITRRQMTNAGNKAGFAPMNSFFHKSSFPDASFKDVVRPNADTYYSTGSLDLKDDPIILSVPNTNDRYYMMPMLDAYTNVFASPGTRTTGNEAHNFLITGPNWQEQVPAGMQQIKSPTNMVWIIGRTQVNSKADGIKTVIPLQKRYKLTPLAAWGKPYTTRPAVVDSTLPKGRPNDIVASMAIDSFFNYVNRLMVNNPPTAADEAAMKKFAAIGVKPGGHFRLEEFSGPVQAALKNLPGDVITQLKQQLTKPAQLSNGWNPMRGIQGSYGTSYDVRAAVAYGGLGANLKEDAMYPSAHTDDQGNELDGSNKYLIHFAKGETPPARAFWSLTMYDPDGYMVANPINRNAIGDRSGLHQNADGSTDIYIQHESPGKDKESNWLPAPAGKFNLLLRVYWPKEEMLKGDWSPAPIKRTNS